MKEFVKKNWVFVLAYVLATTYFIVQHALVQGWDFSAYVLNAKYMFGQGTYFEHYRAPLMPILIGVGSVFSYRFSEFLFIIIASTVYAGACYRLARSTKYNPVVFYMLMLNPFVLAMGLTEGTEVLSLAFTTFVVDLLIRGKASFLAGFLFGAAFLSRYTALSLAPIFLFRPKISNLVKAILGAGLIVIPWLIYNYVTTGNMFTSIFDSYFLNVKFRGYITTPFQFQHVASATNILLPFAILGIGIWVSKAINQKGWKENWQNYRAPAILLFILVLALYKYATVPVKIPRYMFDITLPAAYFAYTGVAWLWGHGKKGLEKLKRQPRTERARVIAALVVVGYFAAYGGIAAAAYGPKANAQLLFEHEVAIQALKDHGIENCALRTNSYVFTNYLGQQAAVYVRPMLMDHYLGLGYNMVLFPRIGEPPYVRNETFLSQFPQIAQGEGYIIIGNTSTCLAPHNTDDPYLVGLNETLTLLNDGFETNSCNVMFDTRKVLKDACNFANR